jgi:hypothetical protein
MSELQMSGTRSAAAGDFAVPSRITVGVGRKSRPARMEDMMQIRLIQTARLRESLRRRLRGALSSPQCRLKIAAAAFAAALGAGALIVPAAAVPVDNLAPPPPNRLQPVVWVCGPFRCWWRPGPYYWGAPYRYWPPAYDYACNPYYRYCHYR